MLVGIESGYCRKRLMDNDDIKSDGVFVESLLTSGVHERKLQAEFNLNKPVAELRVPFSARSIVVPETNGLPERQIVIKNINDDKIILFQLVIAAYNYAFTNRFAAVSSKKLFSSTVPDFISWLNDAEIKNRLDILEEYQAYKFNSLNNHGGASALIALKTIFYYALEGETELISHLSPSEISYLLHLRKTKITPNINKAQKSLASYFGGLDWLRRDDVGIGKELYMGLASPKLTVNSLSSTASVIIVELQKYKYELKKFFKYNNINKNYFSLENFKKLTRSRKLLFIGNMFYRLLTSYHALNTPNLVLKKALNIVLLSNVTNEKVFIKIKKALDSQSQCNDLFLNKVANKTKVNSTFCELNMSSNYSGNLLSIEVLHSLTQESSYVPISNIERLMFSWLMASLTVQPSDIPKLNHTSFRLVKVGGKVTHVECEYFKGRAKVFHTTRSLSTKNYEGLAILSYLSQQKEINFIDNINEAVISNGGNSLTGSLASLINTEAICSSLIDAHKSKNLPIIIPKVLTSLILHGTHVENVIPTPKNYSIDERVKLVLASSTPCQSGLFRLTAIKNSAVHAFSDPYTFHYLVNRNSHTNQTEKENYLNSDNEKWINASGRITREVMLDLINNVFSLDFEDLERGKKEKEVMQFNSEFMVVTEDISYKTGEMLARLKVITGQHKGKINEVGILALDDSGDRQSLSPLYVWDCPITAWKMNNYLHEFTKNYKKLLSRNPDYLYRTAMPTVEWVEYTLNQLSKQSQKLGREMFKNMLKNKVEVSVFHSI